jgi:hypothetical protein
MRADTIRHAPRLRTIAAVVLVTAVALPVVASAHPDGHRVIRDCADDGKLDHHYSRKALQNALKNMPPDIDEYTDCRAVIRSALRARRHHHKHHHHKHKHHHKHTHRHHHDQPTTRPNSGPDLYATGETPASATVFTLSGPSAASGADYTIDDQAKTAWTTTTGDRGVMVTAQPGTFGAIGVITQTPGWSLEVFYSDEAAPGGLGSGDWLQAASVNPVDRREKLSVPDAEHYLVWVTDTTGKRVRINEIQLFQR